MPIVASRGWEEASLASPERECSMASTVSSSSLERECLVPQDGVSSQPGLQRRKSNGCLGSTRWILSRKTLCAVAVLGSATVVLMVVLAVVRGPTRHPAQPLPLQRKYKNTCQTTSGMPACPALGLFDLPEVHKVAAENILGIDRRLLDSTDMELVLDIVAASFRNVSWRIQHGAPRLSVALQMIQLSEDQQDAVVSCLQLMSNPRVQQIGLEVARAVHGCPSLDPEAVKKSIEKRLRPLTGEIRKLRDEVVPIPLQKLWGYGHLWEMTLDMENLRVMSGSSNGVLDLPVAPVELGETPLGVEIGALEEGRALVDLLKQMTRLFGQEVVVPNWVTTVSEKVLPEELSCDLSDIRPKSKDLMQAWFCPLKFGSQGVDALRAVAQLPMKPMEEISLVQSLRGSGRERRSAGRTAS